MPEKTEYRGRLALEYAAQTGAQLMRQRPWRTDAEPIGNAIAQSLWRLGAEEQIFCLTVDHAAVVAAVRREAWQRRMQYALRLARAFGQISRLGMRRAQRITRAIQASLARGPARFDPVLGFVRRVPWPRFPLRLGRRVLLARGPARFDAHS